MSYTVRDYTSKKALKEDFKAGKKIECYSEGMVPLKTPGVVYLEGPHYPRPHSWYASGEVDAMGYLVKLK